MSLKKRLDALRAASEEKIPAESREIMHRAVDDLRASGVLDGVVGPGSPAPRFSLPASDGGTVALEEELAKGPVVLSFFRGSW